MVFQVGCLDSLTLKLEQNAYNFAKDIFNCIFTNENICVLTQILLKFLPRGSTDNNAASYKGLASE